MENPAFQAYALSATLIAVQLILLAFNTGRVRTASKQVVNPEDIAVVKGAAVADREHPDVLKSQRAHANALENAVPFFIVGALYVSLGASKTGAEAYCYTFLAARILHTFFYLAGRQPFRTLSFALGAAATLGMAYHVIRAVI
jgi:glutathione S-transferase